MSKATNFAENQLADFLRAETMALPTSWSIGLLSAVSDGSFTELSGIGYARQVVARSLANFAGTQGGGTTVASTGTSHQTSNNTVIDFGTAGAGGWGTCTDIGFFDDAGNLWFYLPRSAGPVTINEGDPVQLPIGSVVAVLGVTGGMTDYLANKLIDLIFRGQAFTWPGTLYFGLYSSAPSNAGGGTEIGAVGGYARASLAPSLTTISGTQSAGSTTSSTGTGGQVSNNVAITYPTATASWGTASAVGVLDAATVGNLLFWASLSIPKSISSGTTPGFDAGTFSVTFA